MVLRAPTGGALASTLRVCSLRPLRRTRMRPSTTSRSLATRRAVALPGALCSGHLCQMGDSDAAAAAAAPGAGEAGEAGTVQILVKNPTDGPGTEAFKLSVALARSVGEVKHEIASAYPGRPAPDRQRLIFSGKLLANEAKLTSVLAGFDTSEPQTFHLVISGAASRASPAAAAVRSSAAAEASASASTATARAAAGSGGAAPSTNATPPAPGGAAPAAHAPHQAHVGPYPPPWAVPGAPGGPAPYGYAPPPPPEAFGPVGHYPYPSPAYYPYPGMQVPPPAEDAEHAYGGRPYEAAGGVPNGAAPGVPYGAFNGMDPNYVRHLQAMHERFLHDLAAQQYGHEFPGAMPNGPQGPLAGNMAYGFNPGAAPAGGGVAPDRQGGPAGNGGALAGGVAVAGGGGANGPRVRQYVFQFDLNWSLISKLLFLVMLFGQEGSSQRMYGLAGAASIVYLWHTGRLGVLQRIVATLLPTPTQLFDAVVPPAAPAGADGEPGERREINRLVVVASYAYSFVYGFVCSLLPSWEPVQLPSMDEVFNRRNGVDNADADGGPVAVAGTGAEANHAHVD